MHDISILEKNEESKRSISAVAGPSNLNNSVRNSQENIEISAVEPIQKKSAKNLPKKSSFDLPKFSNLTRPKISDNVKHTEQQKKNDATHCRILVDYVVESILQFSNLI